MKQTPLCSHVSVLCEPRLGSLSGHTLDVLLRILRLCSAVYVKEVVTSLGDVKSLLISCRVSKGARGDLLYDTRHSGIVFLFANDLFHIYIPFYVLTKSITLLGKADVIHIKSVDAVSAQALRRIHAYVLEADIRHHAARYTVDRYTGLNVITHYTVK